MFSVIIPTFDRPQQLRRCLAALAAANDDRDEMEVIVVNDGGVQSLDAVLQPFHRRLQLRLLQQANQGPAAARNAGAAVAHAPWLVFLDDDCQVTQEWLARLREHCAKHPAAMIGGGTRNALEDDPYAVCHHLLLRYLYARFNPVPEAARFCASNNLAVPAADFRRLGGFDTKFRFAAAEDRDLCQRWCEAGHTLVYAADTLVTHAHAMTLRSFLRQHYRYGRGARRFHQHTASRNSRPLRVESPDFYLKLLLYPLSQRLGSRLPTVLLLTALSQAAVAAGYLRESTATQGG